MADINNPESAAEPSTQSASSATPIAAQAQRPATTHSGKAMGNGANGNMGESCHAPAKKVLDEADLIPVQDSDGKEHQFGKSCQEYLKALISSTVSPSSLPAATKLVIVGCGGPTLIPMYAEETSCTFPIFTDPTKRLYSLFGMTQTMSLGQSPDYLKYSVLSLAMRGISQASKRIWAGDALKSGDISQVGGEFLFETSDDEQGRSTTEVTWCHRMETTRDHAGIPELKRVLGVETQRGIDPDI